MSASFIVIGLVADVLSVLGLYWIVRGGVRMIAQAVVRRRYRRGEYE
jgi:hypothetical protein